MAGLLLSVGLFLVVMPTSALILSRSGSFAAERTVRWAILIGAGLALASSVDLAG
jgi:Na+-translocating ferredoxin:NAD+ oxidoreductase RnfE subunit